MKRKPAKRMDKPVACRFCQQEFYPTREINVYCSSRCRNKGSFRETRYTTNLYRKRRQQGLCGKCGKVPFAGQSLCDSCREVTKAARRQARQEGRAKVWDRNGYRRKQKHMLAVAKARQIRIRESVFNHYGWVCRCCGEEHREFLTIDHVNNDGKAHRAEIGSKGGGAFYQWLRRNHFPEGFQTLCFNCNWAKWHYGECPHQREKRYMNLLEPEPHPVFVVALKELH